MFFFSFKGGEPVIFERIIRKKENLRSSSVKGRQEKWSWVWRLELYRRDCPFLCKKPFKISVLHNGEVSPWKW